MQAWRWAEQLIVALLVLTVQKQRVTLRPEMLQRTQALEVGLADVELLLIGVHVLERQRRWSLPTAEGLHPKALLVAHLEQLMHAAILQCNKLSFCKTRRAPSVTRLDRNKPV